MIHIESVDYNLKRAYLHQDTVTGGFDVVKGHFDIKKLAATNTSNGQLHYPPTEAIGNVPKTTASFSPRYGYIEPSWRFIPYGGVTHILKLNCEIVSKDQLVDSDVFDLSGLAVNVHIVSDYDAIEIREVSVGSALTTEEHDLLVNAASKGDIYASKYM